MKLRDLRWEGDAFGKADTVAWVVPPNGGEDLAGVFVNSDGTYDILHGGSGTDHRHISALELSVLLKDYTPEVTEKGK